MVSFGHEGGGGDAESAVGAAPSRSPIGGLGVDAGEDRMSTEDNAKRAGPSTTVGSAGGASSSRGSDRSRRPSPDEADTTGAPPSARRAERRPEMIRQRREERRQVYEKRRRSWLLTRIGLGVFAVLAVVGIGYGIASYVQDQSLNSRPDGVRDFQYAGSDHTANLDEVVEYAESPPVGGRHAPSPLWQNCGYYSAPIQNESAVHSLEHGAVWITHQPDLPRDQVDALREKAQGQDYILVSPYEGLASPVVASAWNHQINLDGAEDERLDQFIRTFKEGPDTPELGAACSNGVGNPE